MARSTNAAELFSLLDAVGQGHLIATAIAEVQRGAATARQLLERHAECRRVVEHDAPVDAKAVFDGVTAEQPKTPAEKPLFLHALAMREYMESGHVDRLWWLDTLAMLADGASACLSHPDPTALNNGWWQSHTQGLAEEGVRTDCDRWQVPCSDCLRALSR